MSDYPEPSAEAPADVHPRTADLVQRFSRALLEKLAVAEQKYGYSDGWADPSWMDECREKLMEHIAKGDPRDVAAYCAFLWHHGEPTVVHARPTPVRGPERGASGGESAGCPRNRRSGDEA